ncbi:MAG: tRNA pseudouridine(55) synthase TruB [Clostridia bacterium]|nr:tRNA pseudouridine(55) synthase TruB [Clostridia bacterium]
MKNRENAPSGVVILDKTEGISSQSAVNRLKRLLGSDKAGHTGTLDPLATGVLPILVGRAVKASEYLMTGDKHYSATLLLGVTTDTEDITGEMLTTSDEIPAEEAVTAAALSFIGESKQIPPMYSAIKIGGEKLYDKARRGETVEREARDITVYDLKCERLSEREYRIDVHCSKGTYIRTLLADIGKKLGCGGTMKTLRRTEAAGFGIGIAHTLDEIEAMDEDERLKLVIPTEKLFTAYGEIRLSPFYSRLMHAGLAIKCAKLGVRCSVGERFKLYCDYGFFAIGEAIEEEDGLAIKPIKQFGKL